MDLLTFWSIGVLQRAGGLAAILGEVDMITGVGVAGHKGRWGFAWPTSYSVPRWLAHGFCAFRHCFQSSWVAAAIASAAFPSHWECRFCKSARIVAFA